ncbi:hypothetical protein [Actinophytocola sp.]|uniref:hypothetical protein n=1 Tax=Actinophytocola sp. TaxID=1872138 RepID=UPI002ED4591A
MNDILESRVEQLVARAVEAALTDRFDVRRSRIGRDLVIEIELAGPEQHRLALRVQEGGVLLDVDSSQAMEFAAADERDMSDLEHILQAYCLGELEVQVRLRDGTYHALRTSAAQLSFPDSACGLFRSGRTEWRRIG